jgi:hypothetical protein
MADSNLTQSLIAAGSGLLGVIIGGFISYYTQAGQAKEERKQRRISMATSIAAEIEAYLDLMHFRRHSEKAKNMAAMLRAGQIVELRGFAFADDTPLAQFPVFSKLMDKIGELGPICSDLAKYYTLIAGVRVTEISLERGQYDKLPPATKAQLIEDELKVWESALALGTQLVPRLKQLAKQG